MDDLKTTYKLYALELTKENIVLAGKERFCRITPFYILIYQSGDVPEGGIEIEESETHRLTAADEQWLLDCNMIILADEAKKHEKEIAADMMKRIERLEQALEAERKKAEEQMGDDEA